MAFTKSASEPRNPSYVDTMSRASVIHIQARTEVHPATHYELAFADGGILTIVFTSIPTPDQDDGWRKFKPIHWVVKP